jgi:hypothetical protein
MLIVLLWEVHDFFPATVSDTLTILVQVEALLASLVLTGLIPASFGHLVLPVVFIFDFCAGTALELSMSELGLMKRGWSGAEVTKEELGRQVFTLWHSQSVISVILAVGLVVISVVVIFVILMNFLCKKVRAGSVDGFPPLLCKVVVVLEGHDGGGLREIERAWSPFIGSNSEY